MGKDIEKNLVGQPIFKQLVNLLPRDKFDLLVNHYLQFARWTNEGINFVSRLKDNAVYASS